MAEENSAKPPAHEPAIPEQLRKQLAQAEQIRADMATAPETPTEQQPSPPVGEAAAQPQPETPPSSGQPPAEEDQSWEQRYRSLQGRLENERRSNQQMADRMATLENTIAAMQARGLEPPPNEPPPPKQKPKYVTEQEAEEYGDELLTVVGKRAREEFVPEFEELAARLKRIEGSVQGVGQIIDKNQTQSVYAALNEHVGQDWRDINRSPQFKAWLSLPDPFSGRRREDMIKEAFDRHESGRVVTFFRGFLSEATGTPSASPSPGTSAPPLANGNGSGKPSLEEFAAPGRARSAPQQLPPDKPVYTHAWIAKFMDDKRVGKFRGREAEAEAIERDIYQAQHEGRIQ